jgi:hypothetical protein
MHWGTGPAHEVITDTVLLQRLQRLTEVANKSKSMTIVMLLSDDGVSGTRGFRILDILAAAGVSQVRLQHLRNVEPAGAGQPATQPADKAPAKDQPSPPTSKVSPR